MGVQVQGQVPSLALLQLQPPQGELRKLLQQGWKMFPSKLQFFSWELKSPAHEELGDTRGCIQLQLLHRARPALPGAPVCSSVSICDPPGRDTPSHRPGEPGSGASPLRRKGEEEKGDIQLCQASAPTTHHPQCWTMPCQNHWQPANSLAAKHHPSSLFPELCSKKDSSHV